MFTAALCFLWQPTLRSIGWLLAALALLTGWARVYVGFHFPFDIAGGLLLGAVLATLLVLANRQVRRMFPGTPAPATRPADTARVA
jgi:undecaprenyl-diphosphatase